MRARITDLLSARHSVKDASHFLANAYHPGTVPGDVGLQLHSVQLALDDLIMRERRRRDERKGAKP